MSSNTSYLYGHKDPAKATSRDHTLIHTCFNPLH